MAYEPVETAERVKFGGSEATPLMSWSDGHGRIHCVISDRCYVFLLEGAEGTAKPLEWIPSAVVESLATALRTGALVPVCRSVQAPAVAPV